MNRVVVTNCHLIDGVADEAHPDASIAIEDGLIARIATGNDKIDADEARVIDAQGGWLLPGLWDVHVHLQFPDPQPETISERVIKYGRNAMEGLMESGVTGIRSAGCGAVDRRCVEGGIRLGPVPGSAGLRLRLLPHDHRRPRPAIARHSTV